MIIMNKHQSSTLLIIAAAMIAATNLTLSVVVDILFDDAEALKQKNVGSGESTNALKQKNVGSGSGD
jgi:hypothetical protein